MIAFLFITLIAVISCYILTRLVLRFSLKHKLYPEVRERDVHRVPTPRIGGVAIFLAVILSLVVAANLPWFDAVFSDGRMLWALIGATTLISVLGVLDDLWDLDWYTKLAGQILAAGLLAWGGIQIVSLPIGGVVIGSSQMSLVITILFIVLVMNAVNFIDGLDGLVAGVIAIASAAFLVYSYVLTLQEYQSTYFNLASLISAIILGVCLGFVPLNWNPAKIFMGDSGALLLGLLLAASAVAVTGQVDPATMGARSMWVPTFIPLTIPLAIMAVPLLDFTLAVTRRVLAGKSPFAADRKHLHHRALDMGHGVRGSVLVFYSWTLLCSVTSLLFIFVPWQMVVPLFLVGVIGCLVLTYLPKIMRRFGRRDSDDQANSIEEQPKTLEGRGGGTVGSAAVHNPQETI